jgi:pyrroloquinoline quinone biosynthesis protein D
LRFARGVRLHREPNAGAFLLVPEGVLELSESAIAILSLIDGTRSIDAIAAALAHEFDAPFDELRGDVVELCDALRARGFLR